MEDTNTPPSSHSHIDRDSTIRQRSTSSLSISEPSLRFPRPQGNRRLANWVSTSQPDIMHTTDIHEEHSLLSDSAYEVINNTDTESQDGFLPSESVCSSDYPRSEDVEQDHDEDSEQEEDAYAPGQEDNDSDRPNEAESAVGFDEDEEEDASVFEPLEASEPASVIPVYSEDRVRASSIEYAEESLKMPSANTPSDSKEDKKTYIPDIVLTYWNGFRELYRGPVREGVLYWSGMVILASVMVFVGLKLGPTSTTPTAQMRAETTVFVPIKNPISVSTSTVIINHTSTKTVLMEPKPTSATPLLPASHPVEKVDPKGICSAEVHSHREILVKIPEGTKLSWLAKDAISIDVSRGQDSIKAKFSSVDDGILIEIPKKEAHGVLNVSVTTTRRPKVNETFAIDLGRGALEQAVDFGRLFFEDVTNKLSSSASEVVELMKGSTQSSQRWEETLKSMTKSFKGLTGQVGQQLDTAWREAKNLPSSRPKWMENVYRHHQDLQDDAQLALLRAQISANLVWLKVQGKTKEHDVYLKKATSFMQTQIAAAKKAKQERLTGTRRTGCKEAGRCKGFSLWAYQ